ncbi:MAG: Outer rane efflux protein precursor [Chitinophagaceae bacterium]|nr:Outer rane efflux protein precursor [Chitinophagaceae bacterium]
MRVPAIFVLCMLCGLSIAQKSVAQNTLSLQKALQQARSSNPVLKAEQYNMNIAESDIITAKLRPNLTLNNQTLQLVNQDHFAQNTNWGNSKNQQVWWQLTKTFQLPSQRHYKVGYAQQSYLLSQKNYTETERNLFHGVANKWLEVWIAQKQLDILLLANKNIDSLAHINKLRYEKQVITQSDLLRTQLLADQYEIQIETAERNYNNELKRLKLQLGVADSITIDTSSNVILSLPAQLDSLLKEAYAKRADLQVAQGNIELANTNMKLQKSLALPQPELGMIYNPQNTIPYVGFYGTIDLPFFARNQGEIKKSLYLKAQTQQNLTLVEKTIETEVSNAYNSYLTQQKNIEHYKKILVQSERILSSVRYAYLKGGTTIIDLLEAQRSWLDTRQQYYDTEMEYRKATIELLFVTGLINQLAQ